jgi:catechol 2,3-dioxygenase-like lactoylglutathione lyase family enzyme
MDSLKTNSMTTSRLDHFSIRTTKLDETRRFYADILGLVDGDRPPFDFPGAWLYSNGQAAVHLVGIDPHDSSGLVDYLGAKGKAESSGTGTIDHVAFVCTGLSEMRQRLKSRGIPFRERMVPDLNLRQLFIEDPNGVTIELNYAAAEI